MLFKRGKINENFQNGVRFRKINQNKKIWFFF